MYKSKFKEANISARPSRDEIDLISIVFDKIKFYPKTVINAYNLYKKVALICDKEPIDLYKFQSDINSKTALSMETWMNMFYNSAFIAMLNSKSDILEKFARDVLEDDLMRLEYKFMNLVYTKNAKNISQLETITKLIY